MATHAEPLSAGGGGKQKAGGSDSDPRNSASNRGGLLQLLGPGLITGAAGTRRRLPLCVTANVWRTMPAGRLTTPNV